LLARGRKPGCLRDGSRRNGAAILFGEPKDQAPVTDPAPQPDFSVWSFCFAKGQVPRDFVEGAPVGSNQGLLPIPMVYSVIAAPARSGRREAFIVDTGFAAGKSMTGRSFADFEPPRDVLAKIELDPADVSTILLTHLHFDHAGNIDAFPHARILLQRREYERWKHVLKTLGDQPADKGNWVLSSMNPDDVARVDRAIADGRLTLVDDSHEVRPGLTLRLAADTHTFGSQWVEVSTPDGPYVVASDAVVSYANLERMWPPGYHQGNCWNLLETYRHIKHLVGEDRLERVVVGHDMELFRRAPSWIAGRNPVAEIRVAAGEKSFAGRE
jgi:N-acyl homoserine lactone hydrolase